jgi:hypothetical protein
MCGSGQFQAKVRHFNTRNRLVPLHITHCARTRMSDTKCPSAPTLSPAALDPPAAARAAAAAAVAAAACAC